jgi:glycosyltransferase involved in cell wall biosynthesis
VISLILPYWDRASAADKALRLLAKTYPSLDLEVIVVDDGSITPYVPPNVPLNIRRVSMPYKTDPKAPTTAWNEGVRQANGDIIVLSCVEILHEQPVLEQMLRELERGGRDTYVLAAAWCPDDQTWHCHSRHKNPYAHPLPEGTGRAFCAMLHKDLYWRAGGFDEDYRDGAGYEDVDFVRRLLRAGARFVMRDDLVVTHPKSGAAIKWKAELFARNKALLDAKWSTPITFVCLKAGSEYGPEYVNILRDMVSRNLPLGYPGKFVCLTDDDSGLDKGIETLPLPEDLERWWGKLYLFKRGLFPDGSRIVYFDLDTVLIGPLDGIVKYKGQFATLKDFYQPKRLGPAVMMWEAGDYTAAIWDEWVAEGKPRHQMGDLWWLNNLNQGRFAKEIDKLQDVFPGAFVSFKADCKPHPPQGAKVVCFHGTPRPHQCSEQWVKVVWKIGGGGNAEVVGIANTAAERIASNIRSACVRQLPELRLQAPHDMKAVIVAGGPSLAKCIPQIRLLSKSATIFAVNGAAKYLANHDFRVDAQIVIDARPENISFLRPPMASRIYLASQCDPSLFDAAGGRATVVHIGTVGVTDHLPNGEHCLLTSGNSAGLAAIGLADALGYRTLYLFGYDSSYEDYHHAYRQDLNDGDAVIEALCAGRTFKTSPWMLHQVQQFQELAAKLANDGVTIMVGGDGLLPHVARQMQLMSQLQSQEVA